MPTVVRLAPGVHVPMQAVELAPSENGHGTQHCSEGNVIILQVICCTFLRSTFTWCTCHNTSLQFLRVYTATVPRSELQWLLCLLPLKISSPSFKQLEKGCNEKSIVRCLSLPPASYPHHHCHFHPYPTCLFSLRNVR